VEEAVVEEAAVEEKAAEAETEAGTEKEVEEV
jgi:hypothetical protein